MDRMLSNFQLPRNIIEFHHEAFDGGGYPDGLAGAIPIESRIITVADIFDALTSVRPYKAAWSNSEAFAELDRINGSKVDPYALRRLTGHELGGHP